MPCLTRSFLGPDVNVNALSKNNWTPLHLACSWGKLEAARLLLDNGANAMLKTDSGETALHALANGKHESLEEGVRVAQLLLDRGMNGNTLDKYQRTPLHVASEYGSFEIVRLLLDHGTDANMEDDSGETALHKVSCGKYKSQGGVHVVRLLLDHGGVDVNRQNKKHRTPLHLASYFGMLEIARLLLQSGAKVNVVDDQGDTPLHDVSCGKNDSEEAGISVARLLLKHGADVNARSKGQRTPLHRASYHGKLEIARLLLDHGARVDTVDDNNLTPLHCVSRGDYASEEAGVGVARLLLERGADVNTQSKVERRTPLHRASFFGKLGIAPLLLDHGAKVDAVDDQGDTPLHDVSYGKNDSEEAGISVARLLLKHGADVNARSKGQRTPLHRASYHGKLEVAQLLLDHGARVDTEDDDSFTPLHCVSLARGDQASEEARKRVARLLLEHGADVNARSKTRHTPLHDACYNGQLEITRLLLDHNAQVDTADFQGFTPLHCVSRGDHASEEAGICVARLMLERGADVNAQTKERYCTPLHVASYCGKLESTRLLIDHGAQVDAVDDKGNTPLHYVSRGIYDSEDAGVGIARLLLEHGADVNAKTNSGQTTLDLASLRPKVAQIFLEHGAISGANTQPEQLEPEPERPREGSRAGSRANSRPSSRPSSRASSGASSTQSQISFFRR